MCQRVTAIATLCCTLIIGIIYIVVILFYKYGKINLDKPLSIVPSDYPNVFVPDSNKANAVTITAGRVVIDNTTFDLSVDKSMIFKKYDPADRRDGEDARTA